MLTTAPTPRPRPTTTLLPRWALPFAALGGLSIAGGLLGAEPGALSGLSPFAEPAAVTVSASLERTALVAGQAHEVFARVALTGEKSATAAQPKPRSVTLVIDRSGSMSGDKIIQARRSAEAVLRQLRPGDRFAVLAFGSDVIELGSGTDVTEAQLTPVIARLHELSASGGTNMRAALDAATNVARRLSTPDRVNRVLLLSDGRPDSEAGLDTAVRSLSSGGVLTTTLGVGNDYNEDLMARLADAGLGNYYFIEDAGQMTSIFTRELEELAAVVANQSTVTIHPKAGSTIRDIVGWPHQRNADGSVTVPVGDIYAERTADLLVRLSVPALIGSDAELIAVDATWVARSDSRVERFSGDLVARLVDNEVASAATAVPMVVDKSERVRTAEALEEASQALAEGRADDAKEVLVKNKRRIQTYGGHAKGDYKRSAARQMKDVEELESALAGPAPARKKATKKFKAKARSYKKH